MSNQCKLCGERQTLTHILDHCHVALELRGYNSRHNAVLEVIDDFVRENCPKHLDILTNLPMIIARNMKFMLSRLKLEFQ